MERGTTNPTLAYRSGRCPERGDWALRYSLKSLIVQGFKGQRGWTEAWRSAEPKNRYDVVVICGGGHGLATAYYLAREHEITNVAVLEKGWIGGGGTGRNTTNVRSDYMCPENAAVYDDLGLRLYEGLARELNFNIMLSQRGWLTLVNSQHQMESARHKANWLACNVQRRPRRVNRP